MDERQRPSLEELLAHTRWVEDLARRLVHDPAAASDLAQSAFVIALRAPERPRTELRRWLGTVVRNLARERHRRESQRGAVERRGARPEALPSPLELLARAEAERALVSSVTQLEEPHRTTLLLHYFEGLSAAEIARREGVELSSVAHRLTRAHARLRERLGQRRGQQQGQREGGAGWLAALAPILRDELQPAPPPGLHHAALRTASLSMTTATKIVVPALLVAGLCAYLFLSGSGAEAEHGIVASAPATPAATHETTALPAAQELRTPAVASAQAPAPEVARAEASPPSAPVTTAGGRIHGIVLRPDASPAAARRVRLLNMVPPSGQKMGESYVVCDENGRFEKGELAAGVWSVSTWPDAAELKLLDIPAEGALGGMSFLAERTVDLPENGSVELELGAPPKKPIHVTGRFLLGDRPIRSVAVQWLPVGDGLYDLKRIARDMPDGRYDVVLDHPGRYYVTSIVGDVRPEWTIEVVDQRELTLDFQMGQHVVEGRVVDADGRPVAKAAVELSVHAGRRAPLLLSSPSYASVTDAEGRFRFPYLADATYVVHAHGGELTEQTSGAAVASKPVRAEPAGAARPVELVLAPGVRVPLRILDPQGEEKTAMVFVFDADGQPLNPSSGLSSGRVGSRATIPLLPGRYSVVAAQGLLWSAPVECEIVSGKLADAIELRLESAAEVEIDARAVPNSFVEARDEAGRRFGALIDRTRFNRAVERDWDSEVPRLRLPAGNYVLSACGKDGVLASVRVGLVAGANPAVILRP